MYTRFSGELEHLKIETRLLDESGDGFVYYEGIKGYLETRPIYECRCDERLKSKDEGLHSSHTLVRSGDWNT